MAKKPAKTAFGKKKVSANQSGEKINHTVKGSPVSGYTVFNAAGDPITNYEGMWDAINFRIKLDSEA